MKTPNGTVEMDEATALNFEGKEGFKRMSEPEDPERYYATLGQEAPKAAVKRAKEAPAKRSRSASLKAKRK